MQKQEYEEYENKKIKEVFDLVGKVGAAAQTNAQNAQRSGNLFGLKPTFLDLKIIFNNKIVELSHEFKAKNLSFFTTIVEENGIATSIIPSFLGQACLEMLYDMCMQAKKKMWEYSMSIRKFERQVKPSKQIEYLWKRIRNGQILDAADEKQFDDIEKECNDLINSVFEFNIRDNGLDALIDYISKYELENIGEVLTKEVFPALTKLGYTNIVNKLKEKYCKELDSYARQNTSLEDQKSKTQDKLALDRYLIFEEIDALLFPSEGEISYEELESEIPNERPIRGQFKFGDDGIVAFYKELMNININSDVHTYDEHLEVMAKYEDLKRRVIEYVESKKTKQNNGRQMKPVKKDQQ